MENCKTVKEKDPRIEDGYLIITMPNHIERKINLDRLQELLEWNTSKRCNDLLLNISQMNAHLLFNMVDYDLNQFMGYTPHPDDLYLLTMVADTFNIETNK